MAIPAFLFTIQSRRKQFLILIAIGIVGISTYIPAFLKDPVIVYKNVFGYHGAIVQISDTNVWGMQIFLEPIYKGLSENWQNKLFAPISFLLGKSWLLSILLIVLLSWLRRSQRSIEQIGATITAVYTILYGFSIYCSFQYLAWSLPFWFFMRPRFIIPASIFATGYIYSLYWMMCGNPWLLGHWDFIGRWPYIVIIFRDLTVLFFFVSAFVFLVTAIYEQISGLRKPVKDNIL
jgi:hypothetical protein